MTSREVGQLNSTPSTSGSPEHAEDVVLEQDTDDGKYDHDEAAAALADEDKEEEEDVTDVREHTSVW